MRGIYKITNIKNNKVYIGESLNIIKRWSEHINELKNNNHCNYKLQNDFNKYGINNFKFEVILYLDESIKNYVDKYLLIYYEDKYIKEYNSISSGYNIENTLEMLKYGNKEYSCNNGFNQNIYKGCIRNISNGIYREFGGVLFYKEPTEKSNKATSKLNNKISKDEAKSTVQKLKLEIETWLDDHDIQYEIRKPISPKNGKMFYFNYFFKYNDKLYAIDIDYKNIDGKNRKIEYSTSNDINIIFIPKFWYGVDKKLNVILKNKL